jgi:hypothetical protein
MQPGVGSTIVGKLLRKTIWERYIQGIPRTSDAAAAIAYPTNNNSLHRADGNGVWYDGGGSLAALGRVGRMHIAALSRVIGTVLMPF